MARRLLLVLLLACIFFASGGCASYAKFLTTTADYFNSRYIQSCLRVQATGGGGFGATLNGSVNGFIATGGIDPALCQSGQVL